MMRRPFRLVTLAFALVVSSAFVPSPSRHGKPKSSTTALESKHAGRSIESTSSTNDREATPFLSRRAFGASLFGSGAMIGTAALYSAPTVCDAAASTEKEDKAKILKGYQRLNYLLDNWEAETTICNSSNDNPYIGCERNPIKVMEYLGYKSTTDPLFRADKTLIRLESYVPSEYAGEYQDALDKWVEKADEANGIAYVSSWGEANPGGGKDRVEYFIERSKKNVIDARDSLATVVRILDLK